ncbi:MAG: hypothetical protein KDI88_19265 [Gammaproteobacteria bacterium]|nr:hypothetical protein [Gammaproteobacteria bacterium]
MHVEEGPEPGSWGNVLSMIGAALGLVLVGCGIWALVSAIYFAWGLFRDPDTIAYFARYFIETTKLANYLPGNVEGPAHYLSWIVVILLLLVLGKLGAWAVGAGASLIRVRSR